MLTIEVEIAKDVSGFYFLCKRMRDEKNKIVKEYLHNALVGIIHKDERVESVTKYNGEFRWFTNSKGYSFDIIVFLKIEDAERYLLEQINPAVIMQQLVNNYKMCAYTTKHFNNNKYNRRSIRQFDIQKKIEEERFYT